MASPDSICRLCGSSTIEQNTYIHLFGPLARDKKLHCKIAQFLDEAVGLSDNLPLFVCVLCANQLDSFWCFRNECYTAQTKLRHVVFQQNKKRSSDKMTNNCRLCGLESEQSINVFGPLACDEINMLQYKIIRLLDIAVIQNDNWSHVVCMLCIHKLDSLWCFKNMCQKIEMKLRKITIRYRAILQNNKKAVNNSSDASQNRINSYNRCLRFETRKNRSHTSDSNGIANVAKSSNVCKLSDSAVCSEDAKNSLSANQGKKDEIKLPSGESRPNDTGSSSDDSFDNDDDDPDYDDDSDYDDDDSDNYVEDLHSSSNIIKNRNENSTGISSENNINMSCGNACLTVNGQKESLSPAEAAATRSDGSKEVDDSTTVCENRETSSSKITGIMCDKSCSQQNQPSSHLSAEFNSETVDHVEGHFCKIDDTDNNSDLLCNRIPYLLVKSERGTKHMIYTVFPDSSKCEYDHDYMLNVEHFYPRVDIRFNIEDPNVAKTLVQGLNSLLNGEISLMPYYFGWLNDKNKLYISFRCFICKVCVSSRRQLLMNHISDHIRWTCQACGKFFRTVTRLRHHMIEHASHQYTCPTCNECTGSDLDEYNEHARSHYKFNCLPCKFQCTDEVEWLKHLKNDRKSSESCSSDCCLFYESFDELSSHVSALADLGGFVCGTCRMAYHCEEYLKLHFQVHGLEHGNKTMGVESQVKPSRMNLNRLKNANFNECFDIFKKIIDNEIDIKEFQCTFTAIGGKVQTGFTCVKCDRNLITEKKFRIHVENHMSLSCYLCKKSTFKGISDLQCHIKRCGYKPRKCVSCRRDVWLKTSEEFFEHLTLHQKRKICIQCQQVFLTCEKLERHIIKEHKTAEHGRQWFCEDCNETFIFFGQPYLFKNKHLKEKHRHKLETFVCEICAKTFNSKLTLTSHFKRNHSHEKNNKDTFICAYCDKEFTRKYYLICHIQKHMNEKKFECEICSKAFNRQTSLRKHKLDMHSVKKHQCKMCDKRFTYPSAMVDHMKRAHSYVSKSKPMIP